MASPSFLETAAEQAMSAVQEQAALAQVLVLRRDLWRVQGWSIGSIVAQGAHAAVAALIEHADNGNVKAYTHSLSTMTKHVKEVCFHSHSHTCTFAQ